MNVELAKRVYQLRSIKVPYRKIQLLEKREGTGKPLDLKTLSRAYKNALKLKKLGLLSA